MLLPLHHTALSLPAAEPVVSLLPALMFATCGTAHASTYHSCHRYPLIPAYQDLPDVAPCCVHIMYYINVYTHLTFGDMRVEGRPKLGEHAIQLAEDRSLKRILADDRNRRRTY